jgi:hypothetical protein
MRKALTSLLLAASLMGTGCYVDHHGYVEPAPEAGVCAFATCLGLSAMGATPEQAVAGAMIAGAVVMDAHDGHRHSPYCGCPWRWDHGHRVYWYRGHWEFYDGRWYEVPGGYDDQYQQGPGWN